MKAVLKCNSYWGVQEIYLEISKICIMSIYRLILFVIQKGKNSLK